MRDPHYKTIQPHSGAVILVLHHYLKNREIKNYNVRMTDPYTKNYQVIMAGRTSDEIIFRTGKDWPCYSRMRINPNGEEFVLRHDHSWVQERFKISNTKLYLGELTTEASIRVKFEGDFVTDIQLRIEEHYRHPDTGRAIFLKRNYEIDNKW